MYKKILIIISFVLLTALSFGVEIKGNLLEDKRGNKIPIKEYERIIILDPAAVETFCMIGAEDKIVAIGKTFSSKIYPKEKTEKLNSVGNISKPSLEKILSLSPDLVILGAMSTGLSSNLKTFNISYIVSEYNNIDEILKSIKAYGKLTGKEEAANKLHKESVEGLEKIKEEVRKEPLNLKGTVLFSSSPMMAFPSKSLPGEILHILGVENIAENLVGNRPIISQEMLLKEDPDFLVQIMRAKNDNSLLKNPILKKTKVVRNKNLITIETYKILRGSARIFLGIDELYEKLKEVKNQ